MQSANRQILAYFMNGGRLTVNKALSMFRTTELRKAVSRFRKRGYDIRATWITDTATPDGRATPHKEYYLYIE
jgi:hypothetical protein